MKGQYTAAACVLLDRPASVGGLADALGAFQVVKRVEEPGPQWEFGGPSVVLAYRPEVNGYVGVDTVAHPWPDHMGDPKAEPLLFGAWSMGCFGPLAFPGGLRRAAQQSWAWPDGKTVPDRHRAFVRLRASYVFGGDPKAPVFPPGYDPLAELRFVTGAAAALLKLPGVVCYFNPNGEVLRPAGMVAEALRWADEHRLPPLDLWSNVRMFNVDEGWLVMDTVGNGQFDHPGLPAPLPDLEACFPRGTINPQQIDPFLRNTALYLLSKGPVIRGGDTVDGPGGKWRARVRKRGLLNPPRPTVRFFPDGARPPEVLAGDHDDPLGG